MTRLPPIGKPPARKLIVLCALSLLYFLLMAGTFTALGVVLPSMVAEMRWSWASAGFGFTLLGVACGIASLLPAVMIRRVGVSATFAAGALVTAAGFTCLAVTHSLVLYDIGTLALGLGFCVCGTVPSVYVISHRIARRSTALGIYYTIGGLGSVAGPLLFLAVEKLTGHWRPYWMLCGAATLLCGGFAAFVTRGGSGPSDTPRQTAQASGPGVRSALRRPQFYVIVGAYTVVLLINTTVNSFAVQHLREHGLPVAGSATMVSMAALVGALVSILAGVIGEKSDARWLSILSLAALSTGSGALMLPVGPVQSLLFVGGTGIGLGFCYVATTMLILDYFGSHASLELYAIMCVISTSAAIGPWLGGIVRDRTGSFDLVFLACSVSGAALILLLLLLRPPVVAVAAQPVAMEG